MGRGWEGLEIGRWGIRGVYEEAIIVLSSTGFGSRISCF